MKKKFLVLALILIGLVILGIIKDQLFKGIVTVAGSSIVGAPIHIGGFSLGIITQNLKITDFKMYNPEGFPEGVIIDLPRVGVRLDALALLRKKLHLKEVTVELKEMGLIKNKDKKLNVDALKITQQPAGKAASVKEERKSSPGSIPMHIDVLNLNIGRLVMKDYSAGKGPIIQAYDINIKKTYKDINSPQQLAAVILSEPMKAAGIKGAAIYGVSMLAGVGLLPVVAVATLAGKDSVEATLTVAYDKLYDLCSEILKKSGTIKKDDKAKGVITAEVDGTDIMLKLQNAPGGTQVSISARKLMLPKPEIANGILYQIKEKIK